MRKHRKGKKQNCSASSLEPQEKRKTYEPTYTQETWKNELTQGDKRYVEITIN